MHTVISRVDRKSGGVTVLTRTVTTSDLIQMASEVPDDSMIYTKKEESVFLDRILQKSRGIVRVEVDLGHQSASQENDKPHSESDTFNPNFGFDKEFASNGTYLIEKMHCKKRAKRSVSFSNLDAPHVRKERHLLATIDKG